MWRKETFLGGWGSSPNLSFEDRLVQASPDTESIQHAFHGSVTKTEEHITILSELSALPYFSYLTCSPHSGTGGRVSSVALFSAPGGEILFLSFSP
jgi:hypothetical protein